MEFFFKKKEFLDQLLYTDNKLFLSQIVNVPYTYKLIDLYFSRPTSLWKLTNVRRSVLLFEHNKKIYINSKCFSYQDTLHDCNAMATESGNSC